MNRMIKKIKVIRNIKNRVSWITISLFMLGIILQISCGRGLKENLINYNYTLFNEFGSTTNVGKVIPLTISKSAEMNGVVSKDNKFLYYASNKNGNFDIYVRGLGDIIEKPVTEHAADDVSPQITPDGKTLIFMSMRDDPQGDIFMVKTDPVTWLTSNDKAVQEYGGDIGTGDLVNLTEIRNERNVRLSVSDKYPVISPDGKFILFVSTRSARSDNPFKENIWIMKLNGSDKKQLTFFGATHPKFSPDGKKIIFISYQDKAEDGKVYGEIYEQGFQNGMLVGKATRLTNNSTIELFPTYLKNDREIAYTLIARDSNEDGELNLKDMSKLMYWNRNTNISYPLTTEQNDSFDITFYNNLFNRYDSIVYTSSIDNNLNVSLVPMTGVIPRRNSIYSQYLLAQQYKQEYDDEERYIMGLRRTMDFHANDRLNYIFIPLAFMDIANHYFSKGQPKIADLYLQELEKFGQKKKGINKNQNILSIYEIFSQAVRESITKKNGYNYLQKKIKEYYSLNQQKIKPNPYPAFQIIDRKLLQNNPVNQEMNQYAFMMEMAGDFAYRENNKSKAVESYRQAMNVHRLYVLYYSLVYKSGEMQFRLEDKFFREDRIPDEWEYILKENIAISQIRQVIAQISGRYLEQKNATVGLQKIQRLAGRYGKLPNFERMVVFIQSYYALLQGNPDEAITGFNNVIKKTHPTELIYFQTLNFLGRSYELKKDEKRMIDYYMQAIRSYARAFRNPLYNEIGFKLNEYFDNKGKQYETAGNIKAANFLYEEWTKLMHELNLLGLSRKLYKNKGVEAHTRFIDTTISLMNNDIDKMKAFSEKYNERRKIELARVSYNTAYLFGSAYLYQKIGLTADVKYRRNLESGVVLDASGQIEEFLRNMDQADENLKWVLYMDEEFLEAYLLQGFIYSIVDLRREEDREKFNDIYRKYFDNYLLENTIAIYNKAIAMNDEGSNPDMEGNFYLNLGNSYFVLRNYTKSLETYSMVSKYKKNFVNDDQRAQFHFHFGYSYWQNGNMREAEFHFNIVRTIYQNLYQRIAQTENRENNSSSQKHRKTETNKQKTNYQILIAERKKLEAILFRMDQYLALIKRESGDYRSAIASYNQLLSNMAHSTDMPLDRIYQELAFCHYQLGETSQALEYAQLAKEALAKVAEDKHPKYPLRFRLLNLRNKIGYKFDTGFLVPFILPNIMVLRIVDERGAPIYDMGEDTSIIGDNRIYRTLLKNERMTLTYSLFAYNQLIEGDVSSALEQLERKWNLYKDPKTNFEWEIKAVTGNNLAYYYFQLRQFAKAKEYFLKVSEILSGKKYTDFEKDLINRMNFLMVNFYILENLSASEINAEALINESLKFIENYMDKYSAGLMKESMKKEEDRLKALNQKMTDAHKKKIVEMVNHKTSAALFKLKMMEANLLYYRANLLRDKILTTSPATLKGKDGSPTAASSDPISVKLWQKKAQWEEIYQEYKKSDELYLYLENMFFSKKNKNLKTTDGKPINVNPAISSNKRLEAVLLANRARALHTMGKDLYAASYYLRSYKIAQEYNFQDIEFSVSLFLSDLFQQYPQLTTYIKQNQQKLGEEFLTIPLQGWDYLRKAMVIIENNPVLMLDNESNVDRLYQRVQRFWISEQRNILAGLEFVEREERMKRMIHFLRMKPMFVQPEINKHTQELMHNFLTIYTLNQKISHGRQNRDTVGELLDKITSERERIIKENLALQRKIARLWPHLGESMLLYSSAKMKQLVDNSDGSVANLRFKILSDKLYMWLIFDGKISFIEKNLNAMAFQDGINSGNIPALSKYLLSGLPKRLYEIKQWQIIVDGNLMSIPFAQLEKKDDNNKIFALGDKYIITILPSFCDVNYFQARGNSLNIFRSRFLTWKDKMTQILSFDSLPKDKNKNDNIENKSILEAKTKVKIFRKIRNANILSVNAQDDKREIVLSAVEPSLVFVNIAKISNSDLDFSVRGWFHLAQMLKSDGVVFHSDWVQTDIIKAQKMYQEGNWSQMIQFVNQKAIDKYKVNKRIGRHFFMGIVNRNNQDESKVKDFIKQNKSSITYMNLNRDPEIILQSIGAMRQLTEKWMSILQTEGISKEWLNWYEFNALFMTQNKAFVENWLNESPDFSQSEKDLNKVLLKFFDVKNNKDKKQIKSDLERFIHSQKEEKLAWQAKFWDYLYSSISFEKKNIDKEIMEHLESMPKALHILRNEFLYEAALFAERNGQWKLATNVYQMIFKNSADSSLPAELAGNFKNFSLMGLIRLQISDLENNFLNLSMEIISPNSMKTLKQKINQLSNQLPKFAENSISGLSLYTYFYLQLIKEPILIQEKLLNASLSSSTLKTKLKNKKEKKLFESIQRQRQKLNLANRYRNQIESVSVAADLLNLEAMFAYWTLDGKQALARLEAGFINSRFGKSKNNFLSKLSQAQKINAYMIMKTGYGLLGQRQNWLRNLRELMNLTEQMSFMNLYYELNLEYVSQLFAEAKHSAIVRQVNKMTDTFNQKNLLKNHYQDYYESLLIGWDSAIILKKNIDIQRFQKELSKGNIDNWRLRLRKISDQLLVVNKKINNEEAILTEAQEIYQIIKNNKKFLIENKYQRDVDQFYKLLIGLYRRDKSTDPKFMLGLFNEYYLWKYQQNKAEDGLVLAPTG